MCDFEAHINKKIIRRGVLKEKEQAKCEYREAIEKGHGAYLMHQEQPEVFSVSIGNLPANCEVIIKIVYVAQLPIEKNDIIVSASRQSRVVASERTNVSAVGRSSQRRRSVEIGRIQSESVDPNAGRNREDLLADASSPSESERLFDDDRNDRQRVLGERFSSRPVVEKRQSASNVNRDVRQFRSVSSDI